MSFKTIFPFLGLSLFLSFIGSILQADTTQKMEGTFRDKVIIGALDKVTARTSIIELKVGETVKIGTLKVRAIKAWVSNPEEIPESKVFLEITEKKNKETNEVQEAFRGWMFASNPSISSLEHPVYDIWVIQVTGDQDESDLPVSQLVDEETSQRIDTLIDQLIDQSTNELNAPEVVEVIEGGDRLQRVSAKQNLTDMTSIFPHGYSHNTIGIEIKAIEDKLASLNLSFEDMAALRGLFEEIKTSPFGLQLIQHKGLNAQMTQQAVLYEELIKPFGHYPDGIPLAEFDRQFYELFPSIKATQERGRIFKHLLQEALPKEGVVASCPCGLMDDLLRLNYEAVEGISLVGIDLDQHALDQAKDNADSLNILTPYSFEKRDAWHLESPERFDVLTSNGLNIYVKEEEKIKALYRSFYNSLKPNGILIISALTPPPTLDPNCEWDLSQIDPEALLLQKRTFNDIIGVKWLNFRRSDVTSSQLKEAGFKSVQVYWDRAKIFPTFFCKK